MKSKIYAPNTKTDPASYKFCSLPPTKDTAKFGLNFRLNIVYKFLLVVFLFFTISALFISAISFIRGEYGEFLMLAHKICGFILSLVTFLHVIINRKKLVKLMSEFTDIITRRAQPSYCNMDRLIGAFENHTIVQVAGKLNLNADELFGTLRKNGVRLDHKEQTIREISMLNHEKIFYAIVLIMEEKFKSPI